MCLQDFTPSPASHTLHPANTYFPVWQQHDFACLVPTSKSALLPVPRCYSRCALSFGQTATCMESTGARALIFTPAWGPHTQRHFSIRQNGKAKAGCDANDLYGKPWLSQCAHAGDFTQLHISSSYNLVFLLLVLLFFSLFKLEKKNFAKSLSSHGTERKQKCQEIILIRARSQAERCVLTTC